MDSKQKAKELIETFTFNCRECDNAKLSALFAVQMIRENVPLITKIQQYWIDVENEINKL